MSGVPVIEPLGADDFGPCECCGTSSRTVWGEIRRDGTPEAVYYVHWTLREPRQRGARFRLILGKWGNGATRDHRFSVNLELRFTDRGPQFMVQDSQPVSGRPDEVAGRHLRREEVIGTPLAKQVFSLVDVIWCGDPRIREITDVRDVPSPPPGLPVPAVALHDLFARLNDVSGTGYECDHRFTQTTRFLIERGLPVDAMLAWLGENGAGCDCEVVFNVEENWGESVGYAPPDEDEADQEPEQSEPVFGQFAAVQLVVPRPDLGLAAGAHGVVVDVYTEPRLGYHVEFLDSTGHTLAVEIMYPNELGPV